ncbi:Fc.00g045200.m01.CDS01 [Cosmosporella sp. VM-42]
MNQAIVDTRTRVDQSTILTLTLFDVLANSLLLTNTVPYLPVSDLVNLGSTSKGFRFLIYQTPGVFRHLDLTHVKAAQFNCKAEIDPHLVWHNVQLDEHLTEDEFYSGPLRGVFSNLQRRYLLQDVQTLVLDGLSVTAEICHEIINDPTWNVRLLSIRDVKNLNHGKLRGALAYACRPSRPEGAPKLKALYVFGSKEAATLALPAPSTTKKSVAAGWNHKSQKALTTSLQSETDPWWSKKGQILNKPIVEDWARCLLACQGLISFDAVLCQGPRHRNSPVFGRTPLLANCGPAVATFALGGCASCGKAPEGMFEPESKDLTSLPLLSPAPVLSSSVRAATLPHQPCSSFTARCADCLRERYCPSCNKWWCESCYQLPGESMHDDHLIIVDYDGSWNSLDNMEPDFASTKAKVRMGFCEACTGVEEASTKEASPEFRGAAGNAEAIATSASSARRESVGSAVADTALSTMKDLALRFATGVPLGAGALPASNSHVALGALESANRGSG